MSKHSPNAELTPYDTGDRCEAKTWLPYGTTVTEATPAENFGKVDFENDAGETVAVAYLARGADSKYELHIENLGEDEITVHMSAGL